MNFNLTLIGQLVSFAVFVWFCMKFVWPPLVAALDERTAKIADGLASAERGVHEQELAEKRATEVLHEAKQQASDIIALSQKRAAEIVDEAKGDARTEGERIVHAAEAEVEQEVNRAREHLRTQVATLAMAGAEKILKKEIDVNAHQEILDRLASEI
ncbi:MAG TPA: F0F1 ATP synthase subunit B [Chromatiaceae bacterium]|nr:F0F1 ATP synthase subunit B [Chromatiaceae bacterium]HIN82204.1 F0F1 ATP synthase subunit B [Chromatiales bacterium]